MALGLVLAPSSHRGPTSRVGKSLYGKGWCWQPPPTFLEQRVLKLQEALQGRGSPHPAGFIFIVFSLSSSPPSRSKNMSAALCGPRSATSAGFCVADWNWPCNM